MKHVTTSLLAIVLVAIGTLSFAQKTISKEFEGIKEIVLITASGDGTIKKSSGDMVSLTLTYTYDEEDYEPEIDQVGSKLVLKEKFHGRSARGSASWTLGIPAGISIKCSTGSGDLDASDIDIEVLDMNTGSGDVKLLTINGNVRANTGSGNIALRNYEGEIKANTGSGDVDVRESKGELKVNTGSGTISMKTVSGLISANVGSGDIEADDVLVTGKSAFNSGSGDVMVVLTDTPSADLSVNSGSGDAEVDFNGHALAGTLIMQANKKHGKIVAPVKFDTEEEVGSGNQTVLKKTAELGGKDIRIKIGTGSGKASLSK